MKINICIPEICEIKLPKGKKIKIWDFSKYAPRDNQSTADLEAEKKLMERKSRHDLRGVLGWIKYSIPLLLLMFLWGFTNNIVFQEGLSSHELISRILFDPGNSIFYFWLPLGYYLLKKLTYTELRLRKLEARVKKDPQIRIIKEAVD